jgi:Flp pilus assembly protein TadD
MRQVREACARSPQDPRCWSDRGHVHVLLSQFAQAEEAFRTAVRLDPRDADAWHNLGTALRRIGRDQEAFHALKQALLLDPARANTYLNLGNLLIESGQLEDALECFERAARQDPTLARAQAALATRLAAKGRLDRAESLFRRAIGLDPSHIEGWLGLGRALEDIGDAHGALGCYRNVLARAPGHPVALGLYLALLRAPAPQPLLTAASAALRDPGRDDEGRALIGYGLAKYHDRRAEHAAAAAAGREANAARRRGAGRFDLKAFDGRIGALIGGQDRDFFARRGSFGLGTDQPVFIVGLPRSGTTLTEQIIASHPLMHGAGELPDLARLAARLCPEAPWNAATHLDLGASRERAREYLRSLREGAPRGRLRITDKSPFNFLQLGLAALLFPQARVIHCRRDARDNALSIWLENFDPGQLYATDFGDLARLRAGHERVMRHWAQVLPLPVLTVDYEALVADLESEARRLIDFLGAPWDRRCLDFHRSGRAVQTPSRWQVRQPLYTRSVARWRQYEPYLPEMNS